MASSDEELIGRGSFGKVYKKYDFEIQQVVAVKKIELGMMDSPYYEKSIRKAMKEVEAMEKLDKHERIVQYIRHDVVSDHKEKVFHIFMEYIPGGTISSRLGSTGAFSEEETKRYMRQILEGLLFLHNRMIIHRDVKGSNILLDENDNIKLSDFGLSKCLSELSTSSTTADTHTGGVGTVHWMAPEVLSGKKYGRKADIWSAGATMVEMLTEKHLWPEFEKFQVMYQISQKAKPKYDLDPSVSRAAKQFLDDVLVYNQRPSAEQLLDHCWFGGTYSGEHNLAQYSHESDNGSDLSDHEDFYLPGEEHHIKMEVSVTRREDIKQLFYSDQVYRMSETVRGRALIINTNVFPNRPDLFRKGSAVDVSNIRAALAHLNFEVDVRHDRTAEEMLKDIEEETQRPDHEDYGMHITVLMSHGATYGAYGMLYGVDLKPVKLLDIFDLLSSDNFKHMAGRPKVVIVVADRSERSDGQESQDRGQQTNSESKNYNIEDMLILQSCFDGQSSIRDANYGSPFIRELVKTLYKHSSHTDLATLFDIVQERVKKVTKKLAEKHSHIAQQVPVVTKTLTGLRKVLLFPKYKIARPDTE